MSLDLKSVVSFSGRHAKGTLRLGGLYLCTFDPLSPVCLSSVTLRTALVGTVGRGAAQLQLLMHEHQRSRNVDTSCSQCDLV